MITLCSFQCSIFYWKEVFFWFLPWVSSRSIFRHFLPQSSFCDTLMYSHSDQFFLVDCTDVEKYWFLYTQSMASFIKDMELSNNLWINVTILKIFIWMYQVLIFGLCNKMIIWRGKTAGLPSVGVPARLPKHHRHHLCWTKMRPVVGTDSLKWFQM